VYLKFLLILIALTIVPPAFAQDHHTDETVPLNVALAECPPFVIFENGTYSGLAVYLWEQVGQEMGLTWEYTKYPLGSLLDMNNWTDESQAPDVGISCASITSEREQLIDFSHSFNETYTAIAVKETTLWSAIVGFFTNPLVLKAFFIVLGIAALIGAVFYFLEHRINKKLFSTDTAVGRFIETTIIGLLFVTNGPIGFYRFKTLSARVLATVLALGSTFMIAAVTAVLASSFTLSAMQTQVRDLDDLRILRVGALNSLTSSAFLTENDILHQTRPDLNTLVTDLDAGELDAIVSDAAFLRYHINKGKQKGQFTSLTVLPYELEEQNYAFILAQDSPYREGINRALLTVRKQAGWRDKLAKYLVN
jgi:polar amino acid transport system substrate-binding protein